MVMGKGGVGKTTIAAAVAVELASRGLPVHLSTTDPAAHVASTLVGEVPGLKVSRIDPEVETKAYVENVMNTRGAKLDAAGTRPARRGPAVPLLRGAGGVQRVLAADPRGARGFVVLDTAPTGHTLLLLDATGAYHRQMLQPMTPTPPGRIITPLMRLQDPSYTSVLVVTLPETTPVTEADALQTDLRRAEDRAVRVGDQQQPRRRRRNGYPPARPHERRNAQIKRVYERLAARAFLMPWRPKPPVGVAELQRLT